MRGVREPGECGVAGGGVTHPRVRCEVVAGDVEDIGALG